MKHFISMMALGLMMFSGANAQTETTPNRMILNTTTDRKAYAVDQVDSITFARKDGQVKANVEFLKYTHDDMEGDVVQVKVTRTDPNSSFSIAVLPTNTANRYNTDAYVASYFEAQKSERYWQDFTAGDLSGFETPFKGNVSYTILTMAYDEYGVACESSRAEFTTPKTPTVGTPSVTYNIDELTTSSVKLTVTPNADCKTFYWCQFEKGGAEQQFQQWGPMMGYANVEEMVKGFSQVGYSTTTTHTWDGLAPGTDYEILVLPTDVNGTFGDMVSIYFTTQKKGGDGVASVDVTAGKFEKNSNSTTGYLQTVTFTPNDQTAMFRDVIVEKDAYEENGGDEWAKSYLQTEYPFEMPNWNHYEADNFTFEAEPNKAYYGIAMAKNANGEWGSLVKKEFTTPAESAAASAVARVKASGKNGVVVRMAAVKNVKRIGVVPVQGKRTLKLVSAE